jgi:N-acetylneuraminate synthase
MSVFWTAEIGSNFNNSMDRALKLIDAAKEVGADAVKFQLFDPHKLYVQSKDETDEDFAKKIKLLEERALNINWIPKLSEYCKNIDIQFGCTPFIFKLVDVLTPYVDFLKISSFDILRTDLIQKCVSTNKPVMISLGIINPDNVETCLLNNFSLLDLKKIILMHCSSKYPSQPIDCNLAIISYCNQYYSNFCKGIGWSDHTVNAGVIHKTIALGAEYIEFHFDLEDQQGMESIHGHCWNPDKIKKVIKDVKDGEIASGYESSVQYNNNLHELQFSLADPSDGKRPLMGYRK